MKFDKDPSFQERAGRAAEAKQKALDALRAKAPRDPALVAERQAARLKKEAAAAEKRAAKREAAEAAEAARAAPAPEPPSPGPTEAERKAARDARYAARKSRK